MTPPFAERASSLSWLLYKSNHVFVKSRQLFADQQATLKLNFPQKTHGQLSVCGVSAVDVDPQINFLKQKNCNNLNVSHDCRPTDWSCSHGAESGEQVPTRAEDRERFFWRYLSG